MDVGGVVERVRAIAAVRADESASAEQLSSALRAETQIRSWLAAQNAAITARLASLVSFPEKTIADCTRGSLHDGVKAKERSDTLGKLPEFADALGQAVVTDGHVDAISKAIKSLDSEDQRAELCDRVAGLVDVAAVASVRDFGKRLEREVRDLRRADGMDRFERQRRATRLRSWTDGEGMVCVSARFDPVTGVKLIGQLDAATDTLFAEQVPDTAPTDPIERHQHLQGLALARLVDGAAAAARRPGRGETVVVVDADQPNSTGEPPTDWGLPVEVPYRVLCDLVDGEALDADAVVVRNGVVLHAPGTLNLGRATRLASRDQRRALRALYATCAIPGCTVRYDRCKLHHVVWWRNGGGTDLQNLLPVCVHHHSKVHDAGWAITLGANRELTVRFPDGNILTTGPPNRRAA